MLKKRSGQNLVDYSLIIGLLVIVGLGGLVVFSKELKQFFDDRQTELKASAKPVSNVSVPGTPTAGSGDVTSANPSDGQTGSIEDTLTSGSTPQASNNLIETAGASGVLEEAKSLYTIEDKIRELIKKASAEGKPQWVIDWMNAVANDAHLYANNLFNGWSDCPPDGPCKDWESYGRVQHIANQMSTGQWADQNGGTETHPPPLEEHYKDIKANEWFLPDDPELKADLLALIQLATDTADSNSAKLTARFAGTDSPDDVPATVVATKDENQGAIDTTTNAGNEICDKGGDGTSCNQTPGQL
jgi:Flp pilus assembly pilin Flp